MPYLRRTLEIGLVTLSLAASTACDLGSCEPNVVPPASAPRCTGGCHGDEDSVAPPNDTKGNAETTARGVGAHRVHLASSTWHRSVSCAECHKVPGQVSDEGHLDDTPNAEVMFGQLGGSSATWDGETCSNAYCHGATLTGGAKTTPSWTQVDGSASQRGSCHGYLCLLLFVVTVVGGLSVGCDSDPSVSNADDELCICRPTGSWFSDVTAESQISFEPLRAQQNFEDTRGQR